MVFTPGFSTERDFAVALDAADPLSRFRASFHIPYFQKGLHTIYLCGHSLGLQPITARHLVEAELDRWANLGVEGHFHGEASWYRYHELVRLPLAGLVGAAADEVVAMNGLTVNLHLMMATFFRPTRDRHMILIDEPTFPSDRYAILSQLQHHGLDPEAALLTVGPRPGEHLLHIEDIEECLNRHGDRIAVVLLAGVNFLTGQRLDLARLTELAHRHGCIVGVDLAHAIGNVPLSLHEWNVDFAVWCSYKYLNAGPGAVAGCFVHSRHGNDLTLPRLAGWWGNDPDTRFRMQLQADFVPRAGADGWQLSNPPILSTAPLRASLALFDEATLPALRERSVRLTGYLLDLLTNQMSDSCEIISPTDPESRGCQVSLRIRDRAREVLTRLQSAGVVCDFREPDILRVAPVPLYNTFNEVRQFVHLLAGQ